MKINLKAGRRSFRYFPHLTVHTPWISFVKKAELIMANPLRVLIVEDSVDDTFFVVRELQRGGFQVDFERVETALAMREALESGSWDLVISDYLMPQFDGTSALSIYKQSGADIPFIIVSGAMGEDAAVQIIKSGAHDYIKKENFSRLLPAVIRELETAKQRRARKQTEAAAAYLASLVQSSDVAIIGTALNGTILSWNAGAERIFGYAAVEMIGNPVAALAPPERQAELESMLAEIKRGGHIEDLETIRVRKDGTTVELALTASPVRDAEGRVLGVSQVAHDITRRKRQEQQHRAKIEQLTAALSNR